MFLWAVGNPESSVSHDSKIDTNTKHQLVINDIIK
jgi:hypothetical protein